ncbi:MAG: XylR family transcriptional regulator [Limisphaerales bacterium]
MSKVRQVRSRCQQVALLIETSLAPGRDMLRGIGRYVRERERLGWALYHEARSLGDGLPAWLEHWRGDGILVRVQTPAIARAVKAMGIPVVDLLGVVGEAEMPLVHVDDRAVARVAADHLRERGFHHFAFIGIKGENWSEERRDGFWQALGVRSSDFHRYEVGRRAMETTPWERREDELAGWISALPKPCGLLVCSDQVGLHVLEACRRAGVKVPEELGVVGVDNDEILCEICNPSLSSVDAGHEAVGYEAAKLLDELMRRPSKSAVVRRVRPQGVVVRRSTDVLATVDVHVAEALRIIREKACEGLMAGDVIRELPVSRSVLQRRFRHETGRSLQEEIIQVRLDAARKLLAETELSLVDIAERTGFRHQEYMGAVFRSRLGKTPTQYRHAAGRHGG